MNSPTAGGYLTTQRIYQPHALVYLIGIILYLVLFIVSRFFLALCGKSCPGFCCCCCSGKKGDKSLTTYSNNIYNEMSTEDFKSEYQK